MAETLPLAASTNAGLSIPEAAAGVVVVAHPQRARDRVVTEALYGANFATLQIELNGSAGVPTDNAGVRRLTTQLVAAADWVRSHPALSAMRIGIYGSELAGGAALAAAAARPEIFSALVLRDGRPHVGGSILSEVRAATLLIVNGDDDGSIALGQETMTRVKGIAELEVLSESPLDHDDPETVARVAQLACRWFGRFLA